MKIARVNECNYPIWHIKLWDNNNNNDENTTTTAAAAALMHYTYAAPKTLKLLRGLCVLLILTFMHTLFDRMDQNLVTYTHWLRVQCMLWCAYKGWYMRIWVRPHAVFATNNNSIEKICYRSLTMQKLYWNKWKNRNGNENKGKQDDKTYSHTLTWYLSYLTEDKMKNRWHLLKVICECACSMLNWWENNRIGRRIIYLCEALSEKNDMKRERINRFYFNKIMHFMQTERSTDRPLHCDDYFMWSY